MNFNKTLIGGNMTRDPELKSLPSGQSVCGFGVAVNRKWKDAGGSLKEEVTFIDCKAWGKTGETIAQYFAKGKPIFVEGRLTLEQWDDKEGSKRSKLLVTVDSFQFVGGKDDAASPKSAPAMAKTRAPAKSDEPIESDDIPF